MSYFAEVGRNTSIVSIVADHYNVPKSLIKGRSRKRVVCDMRHIGMWYSVKYMALSTTVTGMIFNRDHSDVIYARDKVDALMDTDPSFKTKVLEFKDFTDLKLKSL